MNKTIEYTLSFVAYLDVLGYSSMIQQSNNDEEYAVRTIRNLSIVVDSVKERLISKWSWEKDKFCIKVFSDCICISIPAKIDNLDAFFQSLACIQVDFLRKKICIRGGIAIGKHFSDDNIVFSEGLVKAYDMESTKAIFPRIIVPCGFWSFVTGHGYDEDIIWFKETYVWMDYQDRQLFIDYLNFMPFSRRNDPNHKGKDLNSHKSFIENSLDIYAIQHELYPKYEWMANYHNSWCQENYPEHPELLVQKNIVFRNLGPFA